MGQYSHLQFFRHTPNAQLAVYFSSKNINLGIDLTRLKETEAEMILKAFTQLPDDQQAEIEAEFQDVNALACEGGIAALIDESRFHDDDGFVEAVAAIDGFHSKVMWAFLEKPTYWRGASMFLHADNVSPSFWKKRNDLPNLPPHVDDEDIDAFAQAISQYFYSQQGRGKNCKVEPYRRNDKEYFFAYPEDFAQSGVEWVSNTLKTLAHHPAFEIIFVYSESEGSLDIYAPKNTKVVPELQRHFAKTILKLEALKDGSIDQRVYDLAPLNDNDFEFKLEAVEGISSVVVTRMRLTLKQGSRRRIMLEADTKNNSKAVYDLLGELTLPKYHITQVGVKVTFDALEGKRTKTRTFNITYPNSCALNYDGSDLKIRKMLAESGIEPKAE
ncbi:MAG: hypothetical protein DIZ80_17425 [endosymbiont of Galathealinum brachiosum]|uniref:Uncharacterized protein n=1 Tax=endosymbiont of Galathealinum brachiosum TaxID=2200906 RepID=A0A370D724_9GAMM|nr:MAG: hypothetical protein DIZ80_17425 [endosymbiont of Galathealinum brachiosum]